MELIRDGNAATTLQAPVLSRVYTTLLLSGVFARCTLGRVLLFAASTWRKSLLYKDNGKASVRQLGRKPTNFPRRQFLKNRLRPGQFLSADRVATDKCSRTSARHRIAHCSIDVPALLWIPRRCVIFSHTAARQKIPTILWPRLSLDGLRR